MDERHVEYSVYIAELIYRHRNGTLSGKALLELNTWIASSDDNRRLFEALTEDKRVFDELLKMEKQDVETHVHRILNRIGENNSTGVKPLTSPFYRRRKWYWMAAALFFMAVSATVFYFSNREKIVTTTPRYAAHPLIQPGVDKAILKLSDGTQVLLDSNLAEVLNQQNVTIRQEDGMLVYAPINAHAPKDTRPLTNTIITPRGGQYKVMLPDGTRVWLNAASSITFPTAFTGRERRVAITGEAYFEVAKMYASAGNEKIKNKVPFVVDITMPSGNAGEIVVLGTQFNINAYPEESAIRTTLVEGSVMLRQGKTQLKIQPGQQAGMETHEAPIKTSYPDMEEVLAWKNGRFKFNNTDAVNIMRQIARWYDVDIKTEGDLSAIRFSGGISRKDDVTKLLTILESEGRLEFAIEGKTIIVRSRLK